MDLQTELAHDLALSSWLMQGGVDDDHHVVRPDAVDMQLAFDVLQGDAMQAIRTFLASLPAIDLIHALPSSVVAWVAERPAHPALFDTKEVSDATQDR